MPLVRISVLRGKPGFGRKVGAVVFRTMLDTMNVPNQDNFQIISEHDEDTLIFDPAFLGIARTNGFIAIQITCNEGRTLETKQRFYQALAERLHAELGVRKEDVLVNLVEVKKENWSFGNGVAQYAE
jgi:phenylpyruvate tautomerase PptA (4-oxalocrotonate tautomerase family)